MNWRWLVLVGEAWWRPGAVAALLVWGLVTYERIVRPAISAPPPVVFLTADSSRPVLPVARLGPDARCRVELLPLAVIP